MLHVPDEVGEFVKVRLPGEAFWARPIARNDKGWRVRVENDLVSHPYKTGDELQLHDGDAEREIVGWFNRRQELIMPRKGKPKPSRPRPRPGY